MTRKMTSESSALMSTQKEASPLWCRHELGAILCNEMKRERTACRVSLSNPEDNPSLSPSLAAVEPLQVMIEHSVELVS